jgi:hypothetical protein
MHSDMEEFNKVTRVHRNDCKVVIERVLPNGTICASGQANMRHRLRVYAHFSQTGRPMLARYSHPAGDAWLHSLPPHDQLFPGASRPFAKAGEQSSVCQVPRVELGKILDDFVFRNAFPKQRCDMP